MQSLLRYVALSCVLLFVLAGLSVASAADRQTTLLPGTDLPSFDYSLTKNTTAKACQSACEGDRLCRAFTFNTKARWCFLKGNVGPETAFAGAVSGRISAVPSPETLAATRSAELPFQADDLIGAARNFAADLVKNNPPPAGATYPELVASGDAAAGKTNPAGAATSYRQALAIVANDPALWLKLATVELTQGDAAASRSEETDAANFGTNAASAALNAFLLSESVGERAAALGLLARGLEHRQYYAQSIAIYRASIALVASADLEARLDKEVAEHGFRVASSTVDADAATPRICAVFSDALPDGNTDISSYVVVNDAPGVAVETEQSQICISGVEYGRRYHVRLRAGLPSAAGESLRNDVDLNLYVPDRKPFVGFANNAYVLPAGLGGGLPITSVNAKTADITIYRIGDRAIANSVRSDLFGGTLDTYSAEDVANQSGEKVWSGALDLAVGAPNTNTVTAIPVATMLEKLEPGAYVITAAVAGDGRNSWDPLATQWFIVTDLGLTTVSGSDGVAAFVRSLDTAKPVAGAKVRLIAVNNEILGETSSDADGRANFAPGLARGEGGRAPQLLVAETAGGDYAFLDVAKAAFDLSDRGVDGRVSPGPLDLFATTERGVYRPGETVFLTALLRDSHAKAVAGLKLTLKLQRPDGVIASTDLLADQGAGSYFTAVPLLAEAMRGSWHLKLYADPKANPLADKTFLVEDFEPERLAFEATAPEAPLAIGTPTDIDVTAKYLYGATAPDLEVQADAVLRPVSTLAAFPGYTFGRLDDTAETTRESLGTVGTTDAAGKAVAAVTLPEPPTTTRPLEAQLILSLIDSNGRAINRTLTRPVLATADRIGIKPAFDASAGIAQGATASFDIIAVAPDGTAVARTGLGWTLSRVETTYQWYRRDGNWKWEAVTTNRQVANGTVDTVAGGPGTVSGTVQSGLYQLEVNGDGADAPSTTYQFYAGYYYPEAGSDTPDKLRVALDKPAYKLGDTAKLRLDPQFAGTALVLVVDDRIISMQAVDVPAGGTTVDLKVTDKWTPGAYVTAMLYRPASAAEKRMPARALGLAYADVDPGAMKLDVAFDVPAETEPRQNLAVKVKLGNVAAGKTAYVSVAAVDVGILNLTNFKTPDPDGWYFGQRQLGVDLRDLYGKLIDPTQGTPGTVRSGGDGEGAARLGTPPATSVLVALDSGIVTVGPDGTATVSFALPDFNGSVRLMAMAWTDDAVGHAEADVVVHDPVVVNLSPPRFLRLGDVSRLLAEIDNVSGPTGTYGVKLDPGVGLTTDQPELEIGLKAGERTALNLELVGAAIGDNPLTFTVAAPDDTVMTKHLALGVRAASGPQTTSRLVPLGPGEATSLDTKWFDGMVPHSSSLTLAIGPVARLNVPEVLLALDRYPYGCAEQVSSRALPLLYLNEVAKMLNMGDDAALQQRIRDAIVDLLSKQTSSGAFGLWSATDYSSDLWLDSYVTEFLLRAKKEGHDVPEAALGRALDNLGNSVSAASDFSNGGEDIAYALYDLARGGRAAIGDLRYYFEARLDAFATPLAKAQLGAALALYGDRTRASAAFAAAVKGLATPDNPKRYRTDYGSQLRDTAAVLALAAEFTPTGVDLSALATRLAALRDAAKYTSTQENAWTLLAAAALARETAAGSITLDGEALTGSVYRRFDQEHFDGHAVTIANTGNTPTEVKVSVTGIPAMPPAASAEGFTLERHYYQLDGTEIDPTTAGIHQNDRFVVVLTVGASELGSGNWLVADPLPAGFEIENPDLSNSGDISSLSWLSVDAPVHFEARTDQYVAAFRYASAVKGFTTAYMVRAVSPGTFAMPGATIEDMYRPDLRANTAAGAIEIEPTGP